MKRLIPTLLVTLAVVLPAVARAADPSPLDPAKLEGKTLHAVNPDDARLLGIIARGLIYQAQKGDRFTPEQARVVAAAVRAYQTKDFDAAYRYASRLLLMRKDIVLDEGSEMATAYDFQLDRKLLAPGDSLRVLLRPFFAPAAPLSGAYNARLALKSGQGDLLQALEPVAIKDAADLEAVVPTKDLKDGKYLVHYELVSPAGKTLVECTRDFLVSAATPGRVAGLRKQLTQLEEAKTADKSIRHRAAAETVAYVVEILERAGKQYVAPMLKVSSPMTTKLRGLDLTKYDSEPFDLDKDLGLVEALAADLLAGKDPLATRTGDLRLAYRSAVDNTLQPFRVYVPKNYQPDMQAPLIIALHGATGDESTYMDRYIERKTGAKLFQKLGEERGYLLATPNGRGPFGGYEGDSEKDVLDVLERVKQVYAVNPKEVFLTGHSMGGQGTWLLGFKHPELFAALAPVAGRPQDADKIALKNAPEMPVLFSAGLKDTLQPPENTRKLAEIAKKELKNFQYVEYPDDHFVIGISSMPAVFDFFEARRSAGR
jgi:predicted esterase